jgi:GDP-L-fucose synthase
MEKNSKIYIAGHTGLVGSALVRKFTAEGFNNLVYTPWPEYDLRNQQQTNNFFEREKPEYVVIAAAKVGGILANDTYRAEFIYDNIMIASNIIHAAYLNKVKKLIFLGSSCIYPKNCPQPMKEEYLLTGPLEPTNEPYAIAKIAGIKLCENYYRQYGCNYYSVMPTNLYGPNDNFDLETSHVLPAIIRKMHLAKCLENNDLELIRKDLDKNPIENVNGTASEEEIINILGEYGISLIKDSSTVKLTLWGTGKPRREFLYVDDLADAVVYLMNNYNVKDIGEFVNIGTGKDLTIKELAEMIKNIVGFKGNTEWDTSKLDGTTQKLLNVNRLHKLGWKHKYSLENGIVKNYSLYKNSGTK